ncbi:MAG: hypothetical protein RSA29_03675 [Clostridium sp.]
MNTNRCNINNLHENDYEDVKNLYSNEKVREFLGGTLDMEGYNR